MREIDFEAYCTKVSTSADKRPSTRNRFRTLKMSTQVPPNLFEFSNLVAFAVLGYKLATRDQGKYHVARDDADGTLKRVETGIGTPRAAPVSKHPC